MTEKEQWYSNKDLFEMVQSLQGQMAQLSLEIQKTTVLIRDYNGLRERLNTCEQRLDQATGTGRGAREMWGYVVGGIGLLLALISYVVR